jgi:hypothetical protein
MRGTPGLFKISVRGIPRQPYCEAVDEFMNEEYPKIRDRVKRPGWCD